MWGKCSMLALCIVSMGQKQIYLFYAGGVSVQYHNISFKLTFKLSSTNEQSDCGTMDCQ